MVHRDLAEERVREGNGTESRTEERGRAERRPPMAAWWRRGWTPRRRGPGCAGARAGEYMMGWANEGRPSPARPPQLPQAINPLDAMYFWLSVFALSTLLVVCACLPPASLRLSMLCSRSVTQPASSVQ